MFQRFELGYLQVAAAAALWGSLGLSASYLAPAGITPIILSLVRAATAAVLFTAWGLTLQRRVFTISWKQRLFYTAGGLLGGAVFYGLYFYTLAHTTLAIAAVLLYTAPVMVVVASRLLGWEPLNAVKIVAAAAALGGVALSSGFLGGPLGQHLSPLVLASGLGAGFTYALYTLFTREGLQHHQPLTILIHMQSAAALFLALAAAVTPGLGPTLHVLASLDARHALALLATGLLATVAPFTLYTAGVRRIGAGRASVMATIEPLSASLWGYLFLQQTVSTSQAVGGALILGASSLLAWHGTRRGSTDQAADQVPAAAKATRRHPSGSPAQR